MDRNVLVDSFLYFY